MSWTAISEWIIRKWDAYEAWVAPFYPWFQGAVAITLLLTLLNWGANKLAPMFHNCPHCNKVIPKNWNPCRMCGNSIDRPSEEAE